MLYTDNGPLLAILTRVRPRRSTSSCFSATPREKGPTRPRAYAGGANRQLEGLCHKR